MGGVVGVAAAVAAEAYWQSRGLPEGYSQPGADAHPGAPANYVYKKTFAAPPDVDHLLDGYYNVGTSTAGNYDTGSLSDPTVPRFLGSDLYFHSPIPRAHWVAAPSNNGLFDEYVVLGNGSPVEQAYYARNFWRRSNGAPAVAPQPAQPPSYIPFEVPEYPALPALQPVAPYATPSSVPWRELDRWQRFRELVSPDPNPLPRPRHWPRPRPQPTAVAITAPRGAPVAGVGDSHETRPPGRGERERKARTMYQEAWDVIGHGYRRLLNGASEALDWLDAVWWALPEDARTPYATPQEKLRDLYDGFADLDVAQAIENIILMELQDRFIGRLSSGAKKALRDAPGGRDVNFFGPHI